MRIAVIQASTQTSKNQLLFDETRHSVKDKEWEVINFGIRENEENFSYIQISLCVGLLINSRAIDFVITGCSSGNGMAIAANALPNVICGYLATPSDAFLFGRINHGNCASLPLGLNFGWSGELNLRFTLEKLFEAPLNTGYPAKDAERKKIDAEMFKEIKSHAQTDMISILKKLPPDFVRPIYNKKDLMEFIIKNGSDIQLINFLKEVST